MVIKYRHRILACIIAVQFIFTASPLASALNTENSQNEIFVEENTVVYNNTSTLAEAELKITNQPSSVVVPEGKTAKVTFSATGDGLKYYWYYKNTENSKFTRTTTFTSNTYSVAMNSKRNERQIYCLIKDKYGNSVKTDIVTLYMGTPLKITKQPVSVAAANGKTAKVSFSVTGDGLKYYWYYKNAGADKFTRTTSFKSNTYSVIMNDSRRGRDIYCLVKDKYGNKVKTDVVTLFEGALLKITAQPSSVSVHNGEKAKVSFTASGSGLVYKWYYKDANKASFSRTKTFTKDYYNVEMNYKRDGRQIYCVVEDTYGNTVKTNTISLSSIHEMGPWEIHREATAEKEGVERRYCTKCSYYNDRSIAKLPAVYYITVNLGTTESYMFGVAENGKYKLNQPQKEGYTFEGFKDSDGNDFPLEGIITENVTINAVWGLDGTNTLQELIDRTNVGVDTIEITSDIVVDKPIFISYNTHIYSNGNYTITRDANYTGDLFVVGLTKDNKIATNLGREAQLTLGGGDGMLTIDGNRDNVASAVNGSALFACESATVNLYDGISIINNIKSGNERIFNFSDYLTNDAAERAGGAAILNFNATVNMYGGIIDNNRVSTEYTINKNEDGTETPFEINGCGGAVYNRGNFNMYGGTISNSEGLRGGALYNDRIAYLISGTISNNTAHYFGGAVASSSSSYSDLFIGSEGDGAQMSFINNHCHRTGGALYSNTSSPIVILGNTEFISNTSSTSGGAIHTAGPLTISDTIFRENSCVNSGGAIYHYYTKAAFQRRLLTITNCEFIKNSANLGGAVTLSASDSVSSTEQGTFATITGCKFEENKANSIQTSNGSGGAIYITRKSEATIDGCEFDKNSSDVNAGAVSVQSGANAAITNCQFNENSATLGGAIHTSNKSTVDMKNIAFNSNSSSNNGGALYIYEATASFENVDFTGNVAGGHAGAIYQCASKITLDSSCEFDSNRATAHGGAIYLTYRTLTNGTKLGAVLNTTDVTFKNNSALCGGAVSIRSYCEANLNGGQLIENTVSGFSDKNEGDGEGGGAVYVGYGKLTLTDVTATANTASDFGGVIDTVGSTVVVNGGTYSRNTTYTGGVIHAMSKSDVTITDAVFSENESTYKNTDYNNSIGGGALFQNGGTLTVSGCTFNGNKTGYYGGAIMASNAQVTINENTIIENSQGTTGAALYFKGTTVADLTNIEITENTANSNGVVYINTGTLNMTNVTATKNKAYQGGVVYSSNINAKVKLTDCTITENTATNGGSIFFENATVTLSNSTLTQNIASNNGGVLYSSKGVLIVENSNISSNNATSNGGAMYLNQTTTTLDNSGFNGNSSDSNGGAIDAVGAKVTAINNCQFKNNTAKKHGGAVYVTYTTPEGATENINGFFTMTGGLLEENSAVAGGAISLRTGCEVKLNGTTLKKNNATGKTTAEGGGAIYAGYAKTLTLTGVTLEENTSAYYGGAVNAPGTDVTVNGKSVINNNAGVTGVAFNFREGGTCVLDDISVTNNIATTSGSGVIYITNGGSIAINALTATGNSNNNGAVIYASGSASISVNNSNLSNNTATTYGGAIDFRSSGNLEITDTVIKSNTASKGGAINVSGTAPVTIRNCSINNNTAASAGAVLLDGGAKLTVENSTFDANSATSTDGGAILVADSSTEGKNATTLIAKNTIFSNNTAKGKGGAVSTDTDSPKLVINLECCTFEKNASTGAGGGAIEIQNKNQPDATDPTEITIVFTDCTFNENTSKTTGAAIEIRTSSVAKIDSITASKNKATGKGGVIYVTSNFSRLYLTGTVAADGNTSTDGNFAYLYNSNYTNPPKIYTTDSSSAAWYSDVKGNSSNIAFDLVAMP